MNSHQSVLPNCLYKKRMVQISPLESRQIVALGDLYGTYLVINAVRFSKSASLQEIGRLLMQMGGFPKAVPPNLKCYIIDYQSAEKIYSKNKMEVAERIRSAAIPLSESFLDSLYITKDKTISMLWKSTTKSYLIKKEDKWAVYASLRKYGPALVAWALEFIGFASKPDRESKNLLNEIIEICCKKDWILLDALTSRIGVKNSALLSGVPAPCQIKIQLYIEAKIERLPDQDERWELWEIQNRNTLDEIIYNITSMPAKSFSVRLLDYTLLDPLERGNYDFRDLFGEIEDQNNEEDEENEMMETSQEDLGQGYLIENDSYAWTIHDDNYDYSTYDPDALESDDLFLD